MCGNDFKELFLTFENAMQIDPKNVCISAGVHFGTCVSCLVTIWLVHPTTVLKVQKYRSRLTVWTITLIKVIRDTFNTWNHSKYAN